MTAPKILRAEHLTVRELGRMVTVTDYAGHEWHGRLDAITLHRDPKMRVQLMIAEQAPIDTDSGGGWYWSTFNSERFFDTGALVVVGEPAPVEKDRSGWVRAE